MNATSKSGETVSRSNRITSVLIALLVGISTIHCQAQPPNLTADERAAAIEKMYTDYQKGFPDVPEVEPAELSKSLDAGRIVLVDVREPREWAVSRIDGAITQADFESKRDSFKDRPIVAYCTIGYRSGQFAKRLAEDGFEASNLRGSLLAWAQAGLPLINDEGETKQVHVYGPQWDLLPDGYESVW